VKLTWFIAKHYLFSRKSTNVINLISFISVVGLAIGTAALIIILSVFNGLEDLIINRYNAFDPDLKVFPKQGKTFPLDSTKLLELKKINGVAYVVPVLEENVLVKYQKVYYPARIKGVTEDFSKLNGIDTMITAGNYKLYVNNYPVAIVGANIASALSVNVNMVEPLVIYVPKRTKRVVVNPEKAFVRKPIFAVGVFSVEPEFDNYVLVPFSFASSLLQYANCATSIEIAMVPNANIKDITLNIEKVLGTDLVFKDRLQQHAFIYKILKSEKMITFLILSMILMIASFTVVGSLSMLIIEKKDDIRTLYNLGMTKEYIKNIFLTEGVMISLLGTILGLFLGTIFIFIQKYYGLIKLYSSTEKGSFIVNAYPVKIYMQDYILVLFTVLFIGFLASKYAVRFVVKRYFSPQE